MESEERDGSPSTAALEYKDSSFLDAFGTNLSDDLWMHSTFYTITKVVISRGEEGAVLDGARVLDIGCGDGNISRWAASKGATEIVGFDMSELQIEKAIKDTNKEKPCGSHTQAIIEYHVRDLLAMTGPEFGVFDIAIGVHILCYADSREKLAHMIQIAASSLKKGGRFVGVRECYDSNAKGRALTKMRAESGQLMFAYNMDVNEQGLAYDYCKCCNEFRNSDGSTCIFTNYLVSESTMVQMFTDAGFKINSVGPLLAISPEGAKLFPEDFVRSLIDDWGKFMWYFDLTKL